MAYQNTAAIMANVGGIVSNIKRVANNTVRYERDGCIVWRLHETDIAIKHPDGSFQIYSGGWKTPTTKDRLNDYSPARVYSGKGKWMIGESEFFEGIRVDAAGKPLSVCPVNLYDVKANEQMKKAIAKFVNLIDTVETLPRPNAGDCWHCRMFQAEKPVSGRSLEFNHVKGQSGPGDDVEHLREHIREGYLHGALLVNAMRWAGYTDQSIGIWYSMADGSGRTRDAFKRALRRYLKRKRGLV